MNIFNLLGERAVQSLLSSSYITDCRIKVLPVGADKVAAHVSVLNSEKQPIVITIDLEAEYSLSDIIQTLMAVHEEVKDEEEKSKSQPAKKS